MWRTLPLLLIAISVLAVDCRDNYIAAVYEHAGSVAIPHNGTGNRTEALQVMNTNMDVLESQARMAAKQVRTFCLHWLVQDCFCAVCCK